MIRLNSFGAAAFAAACILFCADCAAQQVELEIGLNASHSRTSKIEIVSVEGWTTYPDGSFFYLALSYMGERVKWSSTTSKNGRFSGTIEVPRSTSLPQTVYDAEAIFYPDKQDRPDLCNLPYKRAAVPVLVGSPKEIAEFRVNYLKQLRKFADALRNHYDPLKKVFLDYQGAAGFNARKWDDDTSAWKKTMSELSEAITRHRADNLVRLFPTIEEGLSSFMQYMSDMPETMRGNLARDLNERTAMSHVGTGTFIEQIDDSIKSAYTTLGEQIDLKEKLGDEGLIRAWLLRVDGACKTLSSALGAAHGRDAKADDPDWSKAKEAFDKEVADLEAGIKQFEKGGFFLDYPVRLDAIKELPQLMRDLGTVFAGSLSGSADAEGVKMAEKKMFVAFASIVSLLGLSGTLTVSEPTPAPPELKLTPEIEAKIKADIALFASGSKEECTVAGIRLARYGSMSVPFILAALEGKNRTISLWCARVLPMFDDQRIIGALLAFYEKNRDTEVLVVVIQSVGIRGANSRDEAVLFLQEHVKSPEAEVRMACVQAMRQVRDGRLVLSLCECLNDKRADIREQAGIVLQTITGENVFTMGAGYDPNSSERDRKKFIQEMKAYWKEQYPEK